MTASKPVRVDGFLLDIAAPVRHLQRYTSDQRAGMAASHRLGHRQRSSMGEFFWTHEFVPGVAFTTRKQALQAALRSLGGGR